MSAPNRGGPDPGCLHSLFRVHGQKVRHGRGFPVVSSARFPSFPREESNAWKSGGGGSDRAPGSVVVGSHSLVPWVALLGAAYRFDGETRLAARGGRKCGWRQGAWASRSALWRFVRACRSSTGFTAAQVPVLRGGAASEPSAGFSLRRWRSQLFHQPGSRYLLGSEHPLGEGRWRQPVHGCDHAT